MADVEWCRSSQYVEIFRLDRNEDGSPAHWTLAFKSIVMEHNTHHAWQPICVPSWALCYGDYDRPVLFKLCTSRGKLIGQFEASVRKILQRQGLTRKW